MNFNYHNRNTQRLKISLIGVIVFFTSSFFVNQLYARLNLVIPPSVRYWIFWVKHRNADSIMQNQYVRLVTTKIKSDFCHGRCSVVKRVGCISGSHLTRKGRDYFCDDRMISRGLADKPLFDYDGIIPDGKYFMIGDHQRSHDSKAVGFFDEKEIDAILHPLF